MPVTEQESARLELSIVMPCLNEAETVAACVAEALGALASAGIRGEVLVADNGSTDASREIAEQAGARVVPVSERGYGSALRGGIAAARGAYVLMGDADRSYDFRLAGKFVEKLRAGFDLVMGNRFGGGIEPGAMPFKNRYLGNPVLSWIGRALFGVPCRDFHCGLRAFSREAIKALDLQTSGMEFASEMVIKAQLAGLRIGEIAVTLRKDGRNRPPHLRPWRDGWRNLRFMLLFSPRWLFLYPGLALSALGLLLGLLLALGPRQVGKVVLDVHTLFYAAVALLLGFQAVAFAVLTKVFAVQLGLLPHDETFDRWSRRITLETGLLASAVLLLAGFGISVAAVVVWHSHGFGDLEPTRVLRLVIPGGTMMALGVQGMLTSFFLSLIRLPLKR